jgi:hypothetical protein
MASAAPTILRVLSPRDLLACTRGIGSSVAELAARVQEPHAVDRLDPALGEQHQPLTARPRKPMRLDLPSPPVCSS